MKKIYQNFDGLDVTFQGAFPKEILEQLSQAKEQAQIDGEKVSIKLGTEQAPVLVEPYGVPRFSFVFSTGFDGETWFVSNSNKSDGWNIRVSVSSAGLAMHGYWVVKRRILEFLKDMGATGPAQIDSQTRKTISFPKEHIGRFDYCFDFWTLDNFKIDPECIVAHSHSSRNFYGEDNKVDFHAGAKGKIFNSFRIGTMPNRQVGLYNKSEEIKSSSKSYWKDIWSHSLKEHSLRDIDINQGTVWRVEVRAGKGELDKWNLRSFSDLEKMTPDIMVSILKAIRYVVSNRDSNSARWPIADFWKDAIGNAAQILGSGLSGAVRQKIVRDYRENVSNGYRDRVRGNLIGYCAVNGYDLKDLPKIIESIQVELIERVDAEPDLFYDKCKTVKERYLFIG